MKIILGTETVAARLKELRRAAGSPTQRVVAKAVGCAYRSYQNWEQGESQSTGRVVVPNYRNAVALARYFDTTPEYILYGVDKDAPTRTELAALDAKLDRVLDALTILFETLPAAGSGSARKRKPDERGADRRLAMQEVVF